MIASAATLFLDTPRSSLFGRPQKECGSDLGVGNLLVKKS